jgi:hypothetical protein
MITYDWIVFFVNSKCIKKAVKNTSKRICLSSFPVAL